MSKRNPRMRAARAALATTLLVATTSGCCDVRYWRATNLDGGQVFYTVDTFDHPIGTLGYPVFISSRGTLVGLASWELEIITRQDYVAATGSDAVTWLDMNYRCCARPAIGGR